jgi:hypothetical protein
MTITIEFDEDKEPRVFKDVLGYSLTTRCVVPLENKDGAFAREIQTKTDVNYDNLREIIKELDMTSHELKRLLNASAERS